MGNENEQIKIIDCHQHVNFHGVHADGLLKYMDETGTQVSWLLSWESVDGSREPGYQHLSIDDVYHTWRRYPDRFVPFCGVDPRRERAEWILEDWVKKGFRGFGEHKVRLTADHPDSVKLYKLCGGFGLPVLLHIDVAFPNSSFWYNHDIDALERALNLCPATTFIGHGPGFWREISGHADANTDSYPKGPVSEGGKLVRLLELYPNLYADLSAGSGLNAISRDPDFGLEFLRRFHKKLLYGTDCTDGEHIKYLSSLALEPEVFSAIVRHNALSILPL